MTSTVITLSVALVANLGVLAMVISLLVHLIRRNEMTQTQLLNRLMAQDLGDFAAHHRETVTSPKDHQDTVKLENELALAAADIEERRDQRFQGSGIPIS